METRKYLFESLWKKYLAEAPQFDERTLTIEDLNIDVMVNGKNITRARKKLSDKTLEIKLKPGTFEATDRIQLQITSRDKSQPFKTYKSWSLKLIQPDNVTVHAQRESVIDDTVSIMSPKQIEGGEVAGFTADRLRVDGTEIVPEVVVFIHESNLAFTKQDASKQGRLDIYITFDDNTIRLQ